MNSVASQTFAFRGGAVWNIPHIHTVDILSPYPGYVATDSVLSTNYFYSVPLGLVCSKRM